jgi:hypothetical protein
MKYLNEKLFAICMGFIGLGLGLYADKLPSTSLEINAVKLQNAGLFFVTFIAFLYFLCGTKVDIIKDEIMGQHNRALAILVGLIAVALSILFTVNS